MTERGKGVVGARAGTLKGQQLPRFLLCSYSAHRMLILDEIIEPIGKLLELRKKQFFKVAFETLRLIQSATMFLRAHATVSLATDASSPWNR